MTTPSAATVTVTTDFALKLADRAIAMGKPEVARVIYSAIAMNIARTGDSNDPTERLAFLAAAILAAPTTKEA